MTCIVGVVEGDKVFIGGDSAGVSGWDMTVRADQKVFRNGPMVFGFTSSLRMGQILRYALSIPEHDPCVSLDKYMVTTFIDAVRECLKAKGFAKKTNEQEEGGIFLVGYKGRLFKIEADYQVGITSRGYEAAGCGQAYALGVLYATPKLKARARVALALKAAEDGSAGVRAPFHIEESA